MFWRIPSSSIEPSASIGIIGVVQRPFTCSRAHAFDSRLPTAMFASYVAMASAHAATRDATASGSSA